ncbi:hypothetical protein SAMN06893096_10744 [Geodermatophilus pulveris]|uniref:Uncharacterized protein n=1 Tax=Geodermatophilus pulveris TaxID=1564159 RepID=A0A239GTV1_9ACTN|nr:hypothetical protein SAMN06893096_10744 [Geodermatophilus pulveris]
MFLLLRRSCTAARAGETPQECSGPGEGPPQSVADDPRRVDVSPRPPRHLPGTVADGILAHLLIEDGVPGACPGRSSRPYSMRPSNSATVRCWRQPKSHRAISVPSGRRRRSCSSGVGRPSRLSSTRLRLSPTLSLRPSANVMTRAARRTPGTPPMPARHSVSRPRVVLRVARAASAMTTAGSNGRVRATSTRVRVRSVTATPATAATSASASRATCRCTRLVPLPFAGGRRRTCTRSRRTFQSGRPCRTAAETWLTTAGTRRSATVAATTAACRTAPESVEASCR